MKYNQNFVADVCKWVEENGLIEYGGATFKSFCENFHIDDKTYYRWMQKAEFADAIQKAKEVYRNGLEKKLVDSLAKAAQGYDGEYVRTEYTSDANGKPIISKQIKEKRPIAPSVAANIFLLTNLNSAWKNRQSSEVTGADGEPLSAAPISINISEAKPSKVEVEK